MRYHLPSVLALLGLMISACGEKAPDCLTSTGKTVTENRELPAYTEVEISDNIDILISPDSGSTVLVQAGEHIIEKIVTEVSDGRLRISNGNTCNWVRSARREVKVTVPARDATFMLHNGAGELRTLGKLLHDSITLRQFGGGDAYFDVEAEYLNVSSGNTCQMTVTGKVTHLLLLHNSLGATDASGLDNRFAYVETRNLGEVIVSTRQLLNYQIISRGGIRVTLVPDSVSLIESDNPKGIGRLLYPN